MSRKKKKVVKKRDWVARDLFLNPVNKPKTFQDKRKRKPKHKENTHE